MVRDRHPAHAAWRSRTIAALGIACLAAGCASVDGSAPPMQGAEIALEAEDAPRLEYRVRAENGESIALTEWRPAPPPRAVILAVHGFGDYGPSTFDRAARHWAKAGIVTFAYDQRGFGRNPGNGEWPGHDALVADFGIVAALVRRRYPDLPLTVIGHSMGGAVVTVGLAEGRARADKAILLAPAFWGGPYLNPVLRAMALAAAAIVPEKRWSGEGVVKIQASDNIPMLRALGRDPLYVGPPSSREFVGLIRVMDRAYDAADAFDTPVLVVLGAKDEVVPEDPIRAAYDRMRGPKQFVMEPDGWHMLLRDLGSETVWNKIEGFVLSSAESG